MLQATHTIMFYVFKNDPLLLSRSNGRGIATDAKRLKDCTVLLISDSNFPVWERKLLEVPKTVLLSKLIDRGGGIMRKQSKTTSVGSAHPSRTLQWSRGS